MFEDKKKTFNQSNNFFLDRHSYSIKKCLIFIAIILIIFLFLDVADFSRTIRNSFYSWSKPVQEWLWEKGLFTADFFQGVIQGSALKKENKRLIGENNKLLSQKVELEKLREENRSLRKALNLDFKKEFTLEMAKIISKDSSNQFIIINKGAQSNLRANLPLITEEKVLIGKIVEVYENISKARLLSSKESLVNVEVFDKDIEGLLKGNNSSSYIFDLIPAKAEVSSGDLVITSNLGENFPEGLLVGKIKKMQESNQPSFKKALVEPSCKVENLENIFIILNPNSND